jgi:hypothetical protein
MTFADALDFFDTNQALSKALGVSRSRVSQLKSEGGFSYSLQCVLEVATNGRLKACKSHAPSQSD